MGARAGEMSATRLLGAAVVACCLFLVGCTVGEPDLGVEFVKAADVGEDPFVDDAAADVPLELMAVQVQLSTAADAAAKSLKGIEFDNASVEQAAVFEARNRAVILVAEEAGLDVIAPESPSGVGLYGGTGENVCDREAMVAFFDENPAAARAWAGVVGIDVDDIESYLDGLTEGFLLDDFAAINHGYRDEQATPFQARLEAGTAVLVDDAGVPRVRCKCGNPLLPEITILDGQAVESTAFADRVVAAEIGPDVPSEPRDDGSNGFLTNDPQEALGSPDNRVVGLGDDREASADRCEFFILLEFVDNRLIDLPGNDLRIVEVGQVESSFVSIGTSPDDLRFVGEINGGITSFDIADVVEPGEEISHVRLCDGPSSTSTWPGSDIDSVAALSSIPK